jgi:hypothetical protein
MRAMRMPRRDLQRHETSSAIPRNSGGTILNCLQAPEFSWNFGARNPGLLEFARPPQLTTVALHATLYA